MSWNYLYMRKATDMRSFSSRTTPDPPDTNCGPIYTDLHQRPDDSNDAQIYANWVDVTHPNSTFTRSTTNVMRPMGWLVILEKKESEI